jgi:hypothetical protein
MIRGFVTSTFGSVQCSQGSVKRFEPDAQKVDS